MRGLWRKCEKNTEQSRHGKLLCAIMYICWIKKERKKQTQEVPHTKHDSFIFCCIIWRIHLMNYCTRTQQCVERSLKVEVKKFKWKWENVMERNLEFEIFPLSDYTVAMFDEYRTFDAFADWGKKLRKETRDPSEMLSCVILSFSPLLMFSFLIFSILSASLNEKPHSSSIISVF